MLSIELRLSNVDPPAPDPPRTIYRDVLNLPDPVRLGITVRYFNHDDVGLYFRITGSGTGYTFGTVDLGLLGSGLDAYYNLDNFASRAKPAVGEFTLGEFEETVDLILRAYTDAGYTNLKWTFTRTVTVHWIKSNDPAFTQDVLNNFDDGTVQGWAVANEAGNYTGYPTIGVATDYVLSAPYSCKMSERPSSSGIEVRSRLYKSFTTPDKDIVYAIIDLRLGQSQAANIFQKNVQVRRDATVLVFLGRPYNTENVEYIVRDKWMRIVIPLPRNTTLELRIVHVTRFTITIVYAYVWIDDFKIISKSL